MFVGYRDDHAYARNVRNMSVWCDRAMYKDRSVLSALRTRSTCLSAMSSDVFAVSVWDRVKLATAPRITGRRLLLLRYFTEPYSPQ